MCPGPSVTCVHAEGQPPPPPHRPRPPRLPLPRQLGWVGALPPPAHWLCPSRAPATPDAFLSKPVPGPRVPPEPHAGSLSLLPKAQGQAPPPPPTEAQRPHLHTESRRPRAVFSTNTGLFQNCEGPALRGTPHPQEHVDNGADPWGSAPDTNPRTSGAARPSTGHGGGWPEGAGSGGRAAPPHPRPAGPGARPAHRPLRPPPSALCPLALLCGEKLREGHALSPQRTGPWPLGAPGGPPGA